MNTYSLRKFSKRNIIVSPLKASSSTSLPQLVFPLIFNREMAKNLSETSFGLTSKIKLYMTLSGYIILIVHSSQIIVLYFIYESFWF